MIVPDGTPSGRQHVLFVVMVEVPHKPTKNRRANRVTQSTNRRTNSKAAVWARQSKALPTPVSLSASPARSSTWTCDVCARSCLSCGSTRSVLRTDFLRVQTRKLCGIWTVECSHRSRNDNFVWLTLELIHVLIDPDSKPRLRR